MTRQNSLFPNPKPDTPAQKSAFELIVAYTAKKDAATEALSALKERFESVRAVFDASPEDIKRTPLTDEKTAILVRLIRDLGVIYLKQGMIGLDAGSIKGSKAVADYFTLSLSAERIEKFATVFLDGANCVLDVEVLHEGTINQTAVYPRATVEAALRRGAAGIIFIHNHPSGDPTPSPADKKLMATLDKTAAAMELVVFDHMITGRNGHWSRRAKKQIIPDI